MHDEDIILNAESKPKANRNQSNQDRDQEDGVPIDRAKCNAHNTSLETQRSFDEEEHKSSESRRDDRHCLIFCMDMGKVLAEVGVCFNEWPGEVNACADHPNDIQQQCQCIDDEYDGSALVSLGEQEENDKKHDGGSYLGSVGNTDLVVVEDEGVKLRNGNVEWCAIGLVKDERLLIWIEACARGHCETDEEVGVQGMLWR